MMTVLASTIECVSVKLPWQPVLKLLSSPTFVLLGKSPQLTSALSNGWWEVIVCADTVQNKKYIILNMHQILNFLAVADLSPTHWQRYFLHCCAFLTCKCSTISKCCQYDSCKWCQCVFFYSCICLTCNCCQCCCPYIFWAVPSHRTSEFIYLYCMCLCTCARVVWHHLTIFNLHGFPNFILW